MNMALFSVDTSLAVISLVIFCISMLIALVYLIKMIITKIAYIKEKNIILNVFRYLKKN